MTKRITTLPPDSIFVFGSNVLGVHGAGAAKDARDYFGAEFGKGYGHYGQSFAIPTKISPHERMSPKTIECFIEAFIAYACLMPEFTFHVTPIGTGLGGYNHKDIAPMFRGSPSNVVFTDKQFEAIAFPLGR